MKQAERESKQLTVIKQTLIVLAIVTGPTFRTLTLVTGLNTSVNAHFRVLTQRFCYALATVLAWIVVHFAVI